MTIISAALKRLTKENPGTVEAVVVAAIVLAVVLGYTYLVWWLWGRIAVQIFGLPRLSIPELWGASILLDFLIPHSSQSGSKE